GRFRTPLHGRLPLQVLSPWMELSREGPPETAVPFSFLPAAIVIEIRMVHPIQNIVIVGGGTAGWLTAGVIAARHQGRMKAGTFSVTLIESPNVPIIVTEKVPAWIRPWWRAAI